MKTDTCYEIYGRMVSFDLWVDVKYLHDCITAIKTTNQKLLLIDLAKVLDAYEQCEITNAYWLPSYSKSKRVEIIANFD